MLEMITIPKEQLSALQQRVEELAEELRQAKKELAVGASVNEERRRLALDAVNDGLWDWNVLTGEAHFNARYFTMLGYVPDEFPSGYSGFEKLVYPPDLPAVEQALSAHFAERKDSYEIEFRALTKSGEVRWILTRGKVVERDPEGNPLRMVGTHSDITERKRVEEALTHSHRELQETLRELQQSRDMLQTVIESIPIRVFWKDLSLRYLGCNALFAHDAGFTQPRELLGLDDHTMGWREQADLYRAEDRRVIELRQPRLNIIEPQTTSAGDTIWLKTSKVPLCGPDGEVFGMLGVYEDITARKEAEQSQREMTALMQYIVRNDPNAIAVYDRGLHYIAVSNRYLADYNVKEENILGRQHYDVFPEMPQRWKDVHQRCLAGAIERNDDDYFDRPDGSLTYNRWECRPWFTASGEIGGMITYTEVTTERKLAEKALKDSEQRYRSLFDGVPIGLYRTAPDGQILDANPAMVELFGYPDRESLLAANAGDLHVDRAQRAEALEALIRGVGPRHSETKMRRRDGTVIWVRDTSRPVQAPDGRLLYIEGSLEDVTEHKRMEEQYLQAQKMEMVGRLAGGVAHDFNNLLTAIGGYAGLAKQSLPLGAAARSDIDQVILASNRAAQLTRRLLAFSRRQIIEQKMVDLNQLILEMDRMLRRLIGEDIELVTVPGQDLGAVKVDPSQIEQVLVNLSVNARDAMLHGGKLTIETANVTLDEDYVRQHMDVSAGEYVMLAVSDTGTGMTAEAKAHIFEPFFTTKEVGKGTGLGLATVYGIVKQHQGNIWMYSEPGQGTTFKIYLPRVEAALNWPPREDGTELPRGDETVLVVEDEAIVRRLTVKCLIDQGYTVLEAAGGDDALQVFQNHAGTIDLLLTDVIMPKMSGNRLAARLQAIRPDLAVLFTSGYPDDTIAHRGILDEGVAFLQKPFTAATLARKVHQVLRDREDKRRE